MADKIEFTEEQQPQVDKLVGTSRTEGFAKGYEKAKLEFEAKTTKDKEATDQAALKAEKKWQDLFEAEEAKVKELEPLLEKVKGYEEIVAKQLATALEGLSDAAKKAVKALPESMDATAKLAWITASQELIQPKGDGVGTTKPAKKDHQETKPKPGRTKGYKPRL